MLSDELKMFHDWVSKNNLILNITKSKYILFGNRARLGKDSQLSLYLQGSQLEQVEQTKLLGLTLDDHLSWSDVDHIMRKMGRGIAISRKCNLLINAVVLSHLECCSVIWSALQLPKKISKSSN